MASLKLQKLKEYIRNIGNVAVAFSGGVDSTLLAKVASDVLGDKAIAITISAPMHSKTEIEEAKEYAKKIGIKHEVIIIDDIEDESLKFNPENRCYICKMNVFTTIKEVAQKHGINNVLDGTNLDDLGDYRPGLKAIEELNVISPLKEVGLTKKDIREISKELELPTWDKPAFACLITRLPYGEELTNEKLRMIERAENYLHSIGFRQYRVRYHGEVARIEVLPEDMKKFFNVEFMAKVSEKIREFGFKYVALDLEGYRMGKMNDGINQ
ncbi:ATP-dependent sacrificial sulfur transferase LarE [Clostridium sp. D2Q-11]|uniref:ATP-dependent sacrificial sulfur transferase LarE n=1 Tax=Anaeromonas frigoriresistens TaxID=2683708 RepID=A0A942V114_9FIRM|nr:ATP-dependent sacrificial sulfur transferase LarE [Anaeromonas frigoriresistens]MBS4538067.1 ATP-dependent sacrificial sulfur transferase LarE [Anaeromonas frigoriresistens]